MSKAQMLMVMEFPDEGAAADAAEAESNAAPDEGDLDAPDGAGN